MPHKKCNQSKLKSATRASVFMAKSWFSTFLQLTISYFASKRKKKSLQKKVPSLNSIETLWRCDAENKSLGHLKDEEGLTFKMYLLSDPTQMKLPLWVGKIWDVTKLTGHHFHSSFSSQLEFAKGWVLKSWQIFFANLACMSHLDKIMQPFYRF